MQLPRLAPLALAGALLTTACEPDAPLDGDDPGVVPTVAPEAGFDTGAPYYGSGPMLQLGEPLENPYHIDTVRRAYAGLVARSPEAVAEAVPVTHYYVRFLPATVAEVDLLNDATDLELFDHPLLYEIASEGNWYKDPAVEDGYPTWMYSVVPADYAFPAVRYELIDPLHMPNEDIDDAAAGYASGLTATDVEEAALALTADVMGGSSEAQLESRAKKYYPSGRIRVEEFTRRRGYEDIDGLHGIKVRARRGLKYGTTHTAADGTFKVNKKFRYNVRYSVEFEVVGYKITNSLGFSINYTGPSRKAGWNHDFRFAGTEDWAHATLVQLTKGYLIQAQDANLLSYHPKNVKLRPKFEDGRSNAVRAVRHTVPLGGLVVYNDVIVYMEWESGQQLRTDELT